MCDQEKHILKHNDRFDCPSYVFQNDIDGITIGERTKKNKPRDGEISDVIIDISLEELRKECAAKGKEFHAFSQLFFTKLLEPKEESLILSNPEAAWRNVSKFTHNKRRSIDIFTYDFVLFPIFQRSHHTLVILSRPQLLVGKGQMDDKNLPCLIFFESIGEGDDRYHPGATWCHYLRCYLTHEGS